MIISSVAPCRISLFGGGTDVPAYADKYGGFVINMAINLYQGIVLYTDENMVQMDGPSTFPNKANPLFIEKIFTTYGMQGINAKKFAIKSDARLEAGLGSSAAAAVCTLGAIYKYKDEPAITHIGKDGLIKEARQSEIDMGWYGGIQDQTASTYGGFRSYFFSDKKISVVTDFSRDTGNQLKAYMLLYYVGERKEKKIQEGLKTLSAKQIATLDAVKDHAMEAEKYIKQGDFVTVGRLLQQSAALKQAANPKSSNDHIDNISMQAEYFGALGSKVLGAGSGGYMLFMVEPYKQKNFIERFDELHLYPVDFSIDYNGLMTRRIA